MDIRKMLGLSKPEPPKSATLTLGEVVDKYDVVKVERGLDDGNAYIIVSERAAGPVNMYPGNGIIAAQQPGFQLANVNAPAVADTRELGSSSPSPFTGFMRQEYNQELLGTRGLQKYDMMRRSDSTVRGQLRAYKTPVMGARW